MILSLNNQIRSLEPLGHRVLSAAKCCFGSHSHKALEDVVILGVARTPVGKFQKGLAACSAPDLGSFAIRGAVQNAKIDPALVQECFMGLVLSGSSKQAPAKQAALGGGLNAFTPCTAINKVCSSGMKAIMLAAQTICLGHQDVICAGGMESMSNVPFYLPRHLPTYGGLTVCDGLIQDGLLDFKYNYHMGKCAEKIAADYKITREDQDAYAKLSYERSRSAAFQDVFKNEIIPVRIEDRKATSGYREVVADEEYTNVNFERFSELTPSFLSKEEGGTITPANASTVNDGAAAAILSSAHFASKDSNLKPIARIVAYADAALDPIDFGIAPVKAVNKLLSVTGVNKEKVALWEINEAFAVVALANIHLLDIPVSMVNVHGGAVSCGHPLGMSGARITNHLAVQLQPGQIGVAAICNGGGGASSIMLEGL